MSTPANNALTALDGTAKVVSLAIPVAGVVIPLITGIIQGVRALRNNDNGTVTYELLIDIDEKLLDQAHADFQSAIDIANSYLSKPVP